MKRVIFLAALLMAFFVAPVAKAQDGPEEEKAVLEKRKAEMKARNYKDQTGRKPAATGYGVSVQSSGDKYQNNRNYKQQTVKTGKDSEGMVEIQTQEKEFNRNYKRQSK